MTAKEPIIRLHHVTKQYGEQKAVDDLNLSIYPGEIFGLLGPNGAGKSTTILMLLGLSEPTSGKVTVCGLDSVRQSIDVKRKVGYLPDDVGFYEDRTGFENLMYTARLNRLPESVARERAERWLARVGLQEAAGKPVGAYSRGMRQRLGLADVLMKEPDVMILDEPTLGLDPEGMRQLLDLISTLSRERQMTVLLSSHHLHQVQSICDRVGLFVKGRLVGVGGVGELSRTLFGEESIRIETVVEPLDDALLESVRALDGVIRAEPEEGALRIDADRDVAADVASLVVGRGAKLHELKRKTFGLDEIYHRYFEGRGSA
ncbi:ABC transporter ATP-binding protein [Paenibacillus sp.]|uniref:ABC transporter ATP-binding protein n=1 Tax=Paenibacillus sp. TaxID=58172 RepID=UPI002D5769E7|nr:ABC transporter ATP-binding protein [Paenibacillus sp.]HZG56574.1 ABC transporter ATP-binding protein [Paenibacillus sp.]